MKDVDEILKILKPVDAPDGLRRRILTSITSSAKSRNFIDWLLHDWGGWTLRIWTSIPCVFFLLVCYHEATFETSSAYAQNEMIPPVSIQELVMMQKHQKTFLEEDEDEVKLKPRSRNKMQRKDGDARIESFRKEHHLCFSRSHYNHSAAPI
jgi:hypothetical protein